MTTTSPGTGSSGLARRLGLFDAVVLGLGSMLGAGVFAAIGPAAAATGSGLLIALGIAAVVAYCNATASAHLAARHPRAGGTYVYAGRRLGAVWGFLAGWGFVIGKTASCAAMALTVGAYAWPQHPVPVAVAVVVVLTGVNCLGVGKTAGVTRVLVAVTLLALAGVVAANVGGAQDGAQHFAPLLPHGFTGLTQAAGLLFFAFAGYARIATLGEEVRDPARTIPRAIPIALLIVVLVYAAVGVSALAAVGPEALAASPAPLVTATADSGLGGLAVVVRVGGAVASTGVLLSLMAGIGRTTLAMARDRELPTALAAVHPRHRVPHRAELVLGAIVLALVLTVDLRGAIGFSSFAVLVYYALANASAFTLPGRTRRWLRPVTALGGAGCLLLAATLPVPTVLGGVVVMVLGLLVRAAATPWRRR